MPDPAPDDDDARSVLERELYWSGDPSPAGGSTSEVRIGLHDFVASMRADERSPIPRQEPLLGSQAQWKRNSKLLMYRALRPVSRRYDRLLGDLAALTRALADRLAEAEAEIEKLRTDLDERASAGGPGGSSSERARASGSPPGAGGQGGSSSERARASGSPPGARDKR